ncbi:FHIP family protein AGAP011705-like isoform X1 [Schistocerca serialis cubense]|uniref:FHIP family protein AGAP011705-like isoform X1 n=1 Tax=Schistocerca serialis cubense TaxID=2023355 RepID=UPI00214DF8EC|nr:FHIP family protein AGAP011705-like isoform X1 [Schistocerca serialis cubense]
MSWLRSSPLRASFSKRRQSNSPPKDCDPVACYDTFCKHWQQVADIIERTQPPSPCPSQDDVVSVVNHLAQMATLLMLEMQSPSPPVSSCAERISSLSCLEYLLSQNLLNKLYTWSLSAGRYGSTLRLEQLKLYELLAGCSGERTHGRSLLANEAFLRPLLELLTACAGECFPGEVENRIVVLLNQLCVSLVHDTDLMQKFFSSSPESEGSRFVVFALLIPFVHREGGLGQQARDALLLCMALSATDDSVASYISTRSNVCPVLATGLSGLYSRLPRKLLVATDDWHRLTPDDVDALPELSAFLNSVEFCNAVVQVAHPTVGAQLLEFLQQGFLVPVLGPALLQVRSSPEELVAATAYLDLCLRSATEPGLLRALIHFLLKHEYDGSRLLDSLVARIASPSPRLCLVTVALFETLADFDCEDIMLELVLRHLVPCHHVMVSQRVRIRDLAPYCQSAVRFLSLSPAALRGGIGVSARNDGPPSLPVPQRPRHRPRLSLGGQERDGPRSLPPTTPPSLYGDYGAYLRDARRRVLACRAACRTWSHAYDGEDPPRDRVGPTDGQVDCEASLPVDLNGKVDYDSSAKSEVDRLHDERDVKNADINSVAECTLQTDDKGLSQVEYTQQKSNSIGASSSDKHRAIQIEPKAELPHSVSAELSSQSPSAENMKLNGTLEAVRKSVSEPRILSRALSVTTGPPDIGPFLDTLLRKLETLPSNGLYVNLHLTGLVSRLAVYPQPLLHSFLLNHSLVFQPSVRSLFQVLGSLKHRLDATLSRAPGRAEQLVTDARDFLLAREERLANARRAVVATAGSSPDPSGNNFIRGESKRRSFTSTLSSVFRRAGVSVPVHSLSNQISETPDGRPMNNSSQHSSPRNSWLETGEVRSAAMCAVLLDEWLKELAAITQEQALAGLAPDVIDTPVDGAVW